METPAMRTGAAEAGGHPNQAEENEDEKVYYGFGVFMGLPLAELKNMKEDYMKQQGRGMGQSSGDGGSAGAGAGAADQYADDLTESDGEGANRGRNVPARGSNSYGRQAAGANYDNDRRGYDPRAAMGGSDMNCRPTANEYERADPRGGGGASGLQRQYSGSSSHNGEFNEDAAHSDDAHSDDAHSEGSDGSFSAAAAKSHSLNFILH